ncbi:phosphatidylserine decarboxylase protein [Rutstroemia sp. NJR-2017a BVV2]|nr:phosphatidylserine decarboxylase protein [Rutstroemia sp. NJR-2017a BVV2]
MLILVQASVRNRKRSQPQNPEHPQASSNIPFSKRQRTNHPIVHRKKQRSMIEHWRRELQWPKDFFMPDAMSYILARKRSPSPDRGEQRETGLSEPSYVTPSDQKPREWKIAPYSSRDYSYILQIKGSFQFSVDEGITDASEELCKLLLEREQTVPAESIFRDDIFGKACQKLSYGNEARVIQDIARLIVPSAETLATFGSIHLDVLVESVNEGWNSIIPFYVPRPQPDYAVGFKRTAFTNEQLDKIKPFVGDPAGFDVETYFMATVRMYFPFLTSEVCEAGSLTIADRKNAHSMTVALRGIVDIFRLVKREHEVHRQILAFSVSHNERDVNLYGHYPIIDKEKTTFYRHPIHAFSIIALDGKEKWTAYKFIKNIYDIWMPIHLKRLCSVIDSLPSDLNFEMSKLGESVRSGFSQGLESHHLSDGETAGAVFAANNDQSAL